LVGSGIRDPRSGIRDPGWVKIRIRDKHPGSATLISSVLKGNSSQVPLKKRGACLPDPQGLA